MSSLRVALAQITSTENIEQNIKQMVTCLRQGVQSGPLDLMCFPENSLFLRVRKETPIHYFTLRELEHSSLQAEINRVSFPVHITTAVLDGDTRCNATVLMGAHHSPQILYRKIHLFDVDVPGAPPVRESDNFTNGNQPVVWLTGGWKIGLTICYDLRFSELFLHYAKSGVDAVLVPSAFLVPTGEAHWHVLLRARAIESQCYVLAAAQAGEHMMPGQSRQTYGHSLAVDPWGRVLVDLQNSPMVSVVELKRDELNRVRKQIPMATHRRL